MKKKKDKGFTLLELLIVIAIIAILSVALVIVLNPAETLKKARDAQRISDLSTLKTAIGLYLTTVPSPSLGDSNVIIPTTGSGGTISYSSPTGVCTGTKNHGSEGGADGYSFLADWCYTVTEALITNVNGTGWIPIEFNNIPGGSPISNLPVDPINSIATLTAPTGTDLVYRYAAVNVNSAPFPSYVYEINAVLESDAYKVGGDDDKSSKDGGDASDYYEVGTNLRILPTTGF